jgi:hypothetical protein
MPGNRFSRREPEVGFGEITIDLLQARFRIINGMVRRLPEV